MFIPTTPFLTGQELAKALALPPEPKIPVIDELLYRRKVTLWAAAPGCGKSTLATQTLIEATAGLQVFKTFTVPAPCKVYYIAFETDRDEFVYALHKLKGSIPIDPSRIIFDCELIGLDITVPPSVTDSTFLRIKGEKPDIIVFDPFYIGVSGDLSDGAVASKAMRWLLFLAVKCNAAVLLLHHSHRERWQNGKKIEEDDDSYGSRWIQANVVVHYNIKEAQDGTRWKLIKDRYKQSRKEFTLAYDPDTGLSSADKSKESIRDAIFKFLHAHKIGTIFTYSELEKNFSCASGYISHLLATPEFRRIIRKEIIPGKAVNLIRQEAE